MNKIKPPLTSEIIGASPIISRYRTQSGSRKGRADIDLTRYMVSAVSTHDDVIKWKHFSRYWPFVWGIHRAPANSPRKGQWRRALMFSFTCVLIKSWANNREAGDLRRHGDYHDVTVMWDHMCWTQILTARVVYGIFAVKWESLACSVTKLSFKNKLGLKTQNVWVRNSKTLPQTLRIFTKILDNWISI